jgi:hypothetical protein
LASVYKKNGRNAGSIRKGIFDVNWFLGPFRLCLIDAASIVRNYILIGDLGALGFGTGAKQEFITPDS